MMRSRGFTLIEVMTVLGIVGVLAGLSAIALTRLKSRGNFSSATGDFVATLRTARAESFARGDNTVVFVDTQGRQWWAIEDSDASFSFATFDGSVPSGDRLIYYGSLPSETSFGPNPGGPGVALSMPYCGIPTGSTTLLDGGTGCTIVADGGSANPNLKYCSFCDPTTGKGAITFLPSGGASFSGGPLTVGQQISMQNTATGPDGGAIGGPLGIIDFAIVATTGAIEAVTVK